MVQNEASLIAEIADTSAAIMRQLFVTYNKNLGTYCETPIERVLLHALSCAFAMGLGSIAFFGGRPRRFEVVKDVTYNGNPYIGAFYPQTQIGEYRADFYFEMFDTKTGSRWLRGIIECDGHDFHERTKEQAKRDKCRDRWFQSQGIFVLRFSGAEIWNDPCACALDIDQFIENSYKRRYLSGSGEKNHASCAAGSPNTTI